MTTVGRDWWALRAEAGDDGPAELLIYGAIESENDWLGVGNNARAVVEALAAVEGRRLTVRVNSPGGDAFGGVAIANALRARKGHTVARVEGLAASAASLVVLGARRVEMAEGAMLMIHDPWSFAMGGAGDMRKHADLLDKLAGEMAESYARRMGVTAEDARALMVEETWFTAHEAVAAGLADKALAAPAEGNKVAMDAAALAAVAPTYAHAPETLRLAALCSGANRPAEAGGGDEMSQHSDNNAAPASAEKLTAIEARMQEMAAEASDLRAQLEVERDRGDKLAAQLAEAAESARVERRDSAVEALVASGHVLESDRAALVAVYDADENAAAALFAALSQRAPKVPLGGPVSEVAASAANVVDLSDARAFRAEAERIAAAEGITLADAIVRVGRANPEAAAAVGYSF